MNKLVIFGAGGLAREVLWAAREVNEERLQFEILGFVDDNPDNHGKTLADLRVLGGFDWVKEHWSKELRGICGIGNNQARKVIHTKAREIDLEFVNLVHPSVHMSRYVTLGAGVVITAGCILTTQIELGDHVFLNLGCTVGHDSRLHSFVNCAPSCSVSGDVMLKEGVHLGTGVQVIQRLTVGEWTTVGAGAVVVTDLPPYATAVGVPARVIKQSDSGKG